VVRDNLCRDRRHPTGTADVVNSIAPGWYKDPAEPTTQRYWDGEGWIGDPLPVDATPPPGPPAVAPPEAKPRPRAEPAPPTLLPRAPGSPVPPAPVPPAQVPRTPPDAPGPPDWPYAFPPNTVLRPYGHALARPERRLAARAIDVLAVLGLNIVVNGWFMYQWWIDVAPYLAEFQRRWQSGLPTTDIPQPQRAGGLQIAIMVIAVALWFAYEVPSLANTGQTLGKRLLGLKVIRIEEDAPPGFGRAIRRWNPLGLPTLLWTCGIGFVLQFFDCLYVLIDRPLHQALHDKSAATIVVQVGQSTEEAPT
jgi:uncharacterized RDD family membrane protein YckC